MCIQYRWAQQLLEPTPIFYGNILRCCYCQNALHACINLIFSNYYATGNYVLLLSRDIGNFHVLISINLP